MLSRRSFVSTVSGAFATGFSQTAEAGLFFCRRQRVSTGDCWRSAGHLIHCTTLHVRAINIPNNDPENYHVVFRTHTLDGFNTGKIPLGHDGTLCLPWHTARAVCWVDLCCPNGNYINRRLDFFQGASIVFDLRNQPCPPRVPPPPASTESPGVIDPYHALIRVRVRDRWGMPVSRCEWRHRDHQQPQDPPFVSLGSCASTVKSIVMKYSKVLHVDLRRTDRRGFRRVFTTSTFSRPDRTSFDFTFCDRICR